MSVYLKFSDHCSKEQTLKIEIWWVSTLHTSFQKCTLLNFLQEILYREAFYSHIYFSQGREEKKEVKNVTVNWNYSDIIPICIWSLFKEISVVLNPFNVVSQSLFGKKYEGFLPTWPNCRRLYQPPAKRWRGTHMSSLDELSSKFRTAEEFHLWFNLGRGSGARWGVHLGAQTRSPHFGSNMRGGYFWEACALNIIHVFCPCHDSERGTSLWKCWFWICLTELCSYVFL